MALEHALGKGLLEGLWVRVSVAEGVRDTEGVAEDVLLPLRVKVIVVEDETLRRGPEGDASGEGVPTRRAVAECEEEAQGEGDWECEAEGEAVREVVWHTVTEVLTEAESERVWLLQELAVAQEHGVGERVSDKEGEEEEERVGVIEEEREGEGEAERVALSVDVKEPVGQEEGEVVLHWDRVAEGQLVIEEVRQALPLPLPESEVRLEVGDTENVREAVEHWLCEELAVKESVAEAQLVREGEVVREPLRL